MTTVVGVRQALGISNIVNLPRFLEACTMPLQWHGAIDSVIDRGIFLLVLAGIYLVFKVDKVYFAYALPVAVVPAMASLFFSYSRNMMMAFPLFIALALFLKTGARRIGYWALIAALLSIQTWFLIRHISFEWAG